MTAARPVCFVVLIWQLSARRSPYFFSMSRASLRDLSWQMRHQGVLATSGITLLPRTVYEN